MRLRLRRASGSRLRLGFVLALAAGLGAYGVGSVLAVPTNTVYACVLDNIGQQNVRIVHANTVCTANEHAVSCVDNTSIAGGFMAVDADGARLLLLCNTAIVHGWLLANEASDTLTYTGVTTTTTASMTTGTIVGSTPGPLTGASEPYTLVLTTDHSSTLGVASRWDVQAFAETGGCRYVIWAPPGATFSTDGVTPE